MDLKSIIRVGDGRGSIVREKIITAAHCLPRLPTGPLDDDVFYPNLLGPIGGDATVWAECVFVDPIADLAVMACPDPQRLHEQAEAYEALITKDAYEIDAKYSLSLASLPLVAERMKIGDHVFRDWPKWRGKGQLVSLGLELFDCEVDALQGGLWVEKAQQRILGGMSGSPIFVDGNVVGVVCHSAGGSDLTNHREGGPNPYLAQRLPKWLWDELTGHEEG